MDDQGNLSNQPGWVEDCASKDLILFSEDLSPGKRERVLTELRKKNKAVSWGDVSQVQEHLHRSAIISEEKVAYKSGACFNAKYRCGFYGKRAA